MVEDTRPVIGIPARSVVDNSSRFKFHYSGISFSYSNAVERAGGAPILIPLNLSQESLRAIYTRIDGLLLQGGLDVHPKEFGEEPHPTVETDPARDEIELVLTRWALADDIPIFGICRGIQMLNVAAGGTLYQDIPSQLDAQYDHYPKNGPANQRTHPVEFEPGARLTKWLGATTIEVNSFHHQSLKRVAPGLRVVARTADGVVEAVESDDDRFIVGVQFHPELLDDDDRIQKLFEAFVKSARENRRKR
jgi:putative glutamine amidotransferase